MREADGNRPLAAAALGITEDQLGVRIKNHTQLRALWSRANEDIHGINGPKVTTETEALNRDISVLPGMTPEGVELAQMVSESDNELLRKGLKKLGVSDKMLSRLKTLDGLAKSSGHFLSISLEKTHRLYFLSLIGLNEVADELRQRLLAKEGEPGYIASDESRAYFNRNYAEFVKESGNGYKLMMEGAANMVRMLQAANGDEDAGAALGKPKWSRVKKADQTTTNAKD